MEITKLLDRSDGGNLRQDDALKVRVEPLLPRGVRNQGSAG